MRIGAMGQSYEDGAHIVSQGEAGNCMYIVQKGLVEVVRKSHDGETLLSELGPGEIFGGMALFSKQPRSATVRAKGKARCLPLTKKDF